MTRTTNSRIAGSTLLLYIAFGIASMVVSGRATRGEGAAARLASMATHATEMRVVVVLGLITAFVALALAAALYALTRDEDRDLALLALACRVAEGVVGGVFMPMTLGLLALETAGGASVPDAAALQALGAFLFAAETWNPIIAGTFFAVGSTLFSWLFLRGRMIPTALAWLGVGASVLLVVGLPLHVAGVLRGAAAQLMWLPMAAFEIPLALWLLVRGAAPPARQPAT
jgi:hypothetical protein